ncbi:MAG: type 1 glutamine amidotransferase [Ruminococcaceae bacterium]|nr:type 1 glutamine amidotransferase [Oscillospiraceae bacterium]
MKRILIITADMCDDSELMYPYYRMLEEGYHVDIASFEKTLIKAKYHFVVEANISVKEVVSDLYDGLLLPGGMAPEKLRQNSDVIRIVKDFYEMNKPIGAICHGQQVLISANIMKNKNATCYPGIKDDLINAGALYEDSEVVVSGCLVTSRRPEDLPAFIREFLKLLKITFNVSKEN